MGLYRPSFTRESEKDGYLPKTTELEGMELGFKPKDNPIPKLITLFA